MSSPSAVCVCMRVWIMEFQLDTHQRLGAGAVYYIARYCRRREVEKADSMMTAAERLKSLCAQSSVPFFVGFFFLFFECHVMRAAHTGLLLLSRIP